MYELAHLVETFEDVCDDLWEARYGEARMRHLLQAMGGNNREQYKPI